jgi:hypothetical protein
MGKDQEGKEKLSGDAIPLRLSENAHLLRYPHPSSLQRTSMHASRRYRSLAVIPRDFVPQQSLRDGHFPSASEIAGFSTVSLVVFVFWGSFVVLSSWHDACLSTLMKPLCNVRVYSNLPIAERSFFHANQRHQKKHHAQCSNTC